MPTKFSSIECSVYTLITSNISRMKALISKNSYCVPLKAIRPTMKEICVVLVEVTNNMPTKFELNGMQHLDSRVHLHKHTHT